MPAFGAFLPGRVIAMAGSAGSAGGSATGFAGVADFLKASRAAAHQILAPGSADTRKMLLVVGNEAADLDSIVSAMVLALGCQYGALDEAIPGLSREFVSVPALSIPAEDFALRQDAVYLMEKLRLSSDTLVFLPALDRESLSALTATSRLKVVLTDHNKLARDLAQFSTVLYVAALYRKYTRTLTFSEWNERPFSPLQS